MGDRLRLLLSIPDLRGGGAEREMAVLMAHLSRDRFEPHLCLWRPIFTYDHPNDIPVHMLHKTKPWHIFRTIGRIRRLVDALNPDVIYSQLHYLNMATGTALAKVRRRPGWVCRQANDPRHEMRGPFAWWARRALRRADYALGCSEGVSQAMVDYLHLDPARVRTLTNMVDVARIETLAAAPCPIEKRPEVFTVVHAGRLHRQKRQTLLLEAFAGLGAQPAELWMLGEGPLEGVLKRRAAALGIADRVRWLGFQDNPYPLFRAADCFALSSIYEGLPNTIIEALLCGTPVISTDCPHGPSELIRPGETGLLAPMRDPVMLTHALAMLAGAPDRRRAMGAAGRAWARETFDTVRVCRQYEAVFEDAAARAAQ